MTFSPPTVLHMHAFLLFEHPDQLEYRRNIHPARYGRWLLSSLGVLDNMAGKNGNGRKNFDPVEFVTINLDAEMEKAFRSYAKENAEKLVTLISEFCAEPHKIGLSWDDGNNCFIVSATCKNERSDNHNMCITARSDDWSEALLLVLFKANVVAKGGTWSQVSRPNAWG